MDVGGCSGLGVAVVIVCGVFRAHAAVVVLYLQCQWLAQLLPILAAFVLCSAPVFAHTGPSQHTIL
jgi:hypothetical protein